MTTTPPAAPLPNVEPLPQVDPEGLNRTQRVGLACASCDKRWPRPRHPVGRLPDGRVLYLCDDCAGGCDGDP